MSSERRTLIIDGDVSKGVAALDQLDAKVDDVAASAKKIGTEFDRVEGKAKEAERGVSGLHNETRKAGGGVTSLTFGFNQAVDAVQKLIAGVQALDAAMQQTFQQHAILDNLPFQINKVRDSTMGLIDDMTLSRVAVAANRSEVVKTEEEFAALAEAGTRLGLSVGQDATKSVEDLALALARGSPMILDNLGIQLKMSDAHKEYAERIGVSVSALTEEQKAEAFRVIGLEKAIEVSKRVTITVSESEQAWIRANQQYDKLVRETLPAMTGELEGVWGALEEGGKIAADVLPPLVRYLGVVLEGVKPLLAVMAFFARQLAAVARVVETVGDNVGALTETAGEAKDSFVEWATDSKLNEWALKAKKGVAELASSGIEALTDKVKEHIPWAEDAALAWDEVARAIAHTNAESHKMSAIGDAQKRLTEFLDKAKDTGTEIAATEARKLATLKSAASETEHQVKLAEAQKRPASELERLYRAQHTAKLELLLATKDHAKIEAALRDEEVRQAAARARGGGRGPTEADRVKAAGEIQIQQWNDKLALQEAEASLRGITDREADRFAQARYGIAIRQLQVERETLEVTRAKDSVERAKNESQIESIDKQLELLSIEKQSAEIATQRGRDKADAEADLAFMDREIARLQALGVATKILEQQRAEAKLVATELYGTSAELLQVEHEQTLLRIATEREESILDRETELARFDERMAMLEAQGIAVTEYGDQRLALEYALAEAEGDADKRRQVLHKREVARTKERLQKQQAAVQATSGFLGQGQAFASMIVDNAIKDDKRREKAALRLNGVMAMARGALEVVEAVASFAKYDFVGGALHVAASVVAFAQGGMMLAGNVPGGGSAGAGGAAGGGAAANTSGYGASSSSRDSPVTPPSAEELTRIRGGYGSGSSSSSDAGKNSNGGTTINAGIIVTGDQGYMLDEINRKDKKAWG